jgi:hypothetical protein
MPIDSLPTPPTPADPVATFDARAFAFLAALTTFQVQANALALEVEANADTTAALILGLALPNYTGTSTTTNAIGTGPKSFVTQSGKSWVVGQSVVASNGSTYMKGAVTAYTGSALDINIDTVFGSGSFSSWQLALTFAGLPLTDETTINGQTLGYRHVPQNSQSAAYSLALTDAGKHILHPSADTTARTITIPANASVAFPVGAAITIVNQNAAGVLTIAITSDTLRYAGAGTTGSRTLAANGMATLLKIAATEWMISGVGLT